MNYLKSYVLFRVPRDEEMISAAMESCIVTEHLLEQGALISHDVVNGVQGLGFTPHEEFLPGSAPTVASSAPRVRPGPDISRRTLSAIKDQIRIHRGRARELRRQAVEKKEDARRNGNEEWRLFYQASELDEKVVYLDRQEACLDRKISTLRTEETLLRRTYKMLNWLLRRLPLI